MMDILDEAFRGVNKTKIVYRANLNFMRFEKYFHEFMEKGLIEVAENPDNNTTLYKTTEKGKELLELLKEVQKLV